MEPVQIPLKKKYRLSASERGIKRINFVPKHSRKTRTRSTKYLKWARANPKSAKS